VIFKYNPAIDLILRNPIVQLYLVYIDKLAWKRLEILGTLGLTSTMIFT
jgi:hypothetical protein